MVIYSVWEFIVRLFRRRKPALPSRAEQPQAHQTTRGSGTWRRARRVVEAEVDTNDTGTAALSTEIIAGRNCDLCSDRLDGRNALIAHYLQTHEVPAGNSVEKLIRDGEAGLEAGFSTLKDHLAFSFKDNIAAFERFRSAFGSEVGLMHDAALANYNYEEAIEVGRALESTGYIWFEEPIDDRLHEQNVQLCQSLDIPIAGAETLMHDPQIGELWLRTGAVDILRVHARHGTTAVRRLATGAAELGMNVEPNAYGPLFGLVHAHVACGIENIDWFETAPPPNGAAMGEEIGLLNPVRPVDGQVTYPSEPRWGAVWDSKRFESKRVAVL